MTFLNPHNYSIHAEYLHDFVSEVINDLHGNSFGNWLVKRPRRIAVKSLPCLFVDLPLQSRLERFVGIACAKEVCLTNEETLLVVIGVNEPAGNSIGTVATDLACAWVENIDPIHLDSNLPVTDI